MSNSDFQSPVSGIFLEVDNQYLENNILPGRKLDLPSSKRIFAIRAGLERLRWAGEEQCPCFFTAWPSSCSKISAPTILAVFGAQLPRPTYSLSTLRSAPYDTPRKTRLRMVDSLSAREFNPPDSRNGFMPYVDYSLCHRHPP